jgi:PRC-barrel domain
VGENEQIETEAADQTEAETTDESAGSTGAAVAVTHQDLAEWRGRDLNDVNGDRIGQLEDVYFDIDTDEPQFGTVKEGLFGRHLTFVPLIGAEVGPDNLQVATTVDQVKSAPNIALEGDQLSPEDESALYHHYHLNYAPSDRESKKRLVRH